MFWLFWFSERRDEWWDRWCDPPTVSWQWCVNVLRESCILNHGTDDRTYRRLEIGRDTECPRGPTLIRIDSQSSSRKRKTSSILRGNNDSVELGDHNLIMYLMRRGLWLEWVLRAPKAPKLICVHRNSYRVRALGIPREVETSEVYRRGWLSESSRNS